MDPFQNPLKERAGLIKEEGGFIYYRDNSGKIRKFEKHREENKKIRLKFFEKPYLFWKRLQVDQRANIISFSLFLAVPWIVYYSSLWFTEREMRMKIKAQLPQEVTDRSYFKNWQEKKKEEYRDSVPNEKIQN